MNAFTVLMRVVLVVVILIILVMFGSLLIPEQALGSIDQVLTYLPTVSISEKPCSFYCYAQQEQSEIELINSGLNKIPDYNRALLLPTYFSCNYYLLDVATQVLELSRWEAQEPTVLYTGITCTDDLLLYRPADLISGILPTNICYLNLDDVASISSYECNLYKIKNWLVECNEGVYCSYDGTSLSCSTGGSVDYDNYAIIGGTPVTCTIGANDAITCGPNPLTGTTPSCAFNYDIRLICPISRCLTNEMYVNVTAVEHGFSDHCALDVVHPTSLQSYSSTYPLEPIINSNCDFRFFLSGGTFTCSPIYQYGLGYFSGGKCFKNSGSTFSCGFLDGDDCEKAVWFYEGGDPVYCDIECTYAEATGVTCTYGRCTEWLSDQGGLYPNPPVDCTLNAEGTPYETCDVVDLPAECVVTVGSDGTVTISCPLIYETDPQGYTYTTIDDSGTMEECLVFYNPEECNLICGIETPELISGLVETTSTGCTVSNPELQTQCDFRRTEISVCETSCEYLPAEYFGQYYCRPQNNNCRLTACQEYDSVLTTYCTKGTWSYDVGDSMNYIELNPEANWSIYPPKDSLMQLIPPYSGEIFENIYGYRVLGIYALDIGEYTFLHELYDRGANFFKQNINWPRFDVLVKPNGEVLLPRDQISRLQEGLRGHYISFEFGHLFGASVPAQEFTHKFRGAVTNPKYFENATQFLYDCVSGGLCDNHPLHTFKNFCTVDPFLQKYDYINCLEDRTMTDKLNVADFSFEWRSGKDIRNGFYCDPGMYDACSFELLNFNNCMPAWITLLRGQDGNDLTGARCEDYALLYYTLFKTLGVEEYKNQDEDPWVKVDFSHCDLPCACKQLVEACGGNYIECDDQVCEYDEENSQIICGESDYHDNCQVEDDEINCYEQTITCDIISLGQGEFEMDCSQDVNCEYETGVVSCDGGTYVNCFAQENHVECYDVELGCSVNTVMDYTQEMCAGPQYVTVSINDDPTVGGRFNACPTTMINYPTGWDDPATPGWAIDQTKPVMGSIHKVRVGDLEFEIIQDFNAGSDYYYPVILNKSFGYLNDSYVMWDTLSSSWHTYYCNSVGKASCDVCEVNPYSSNEPQDLINACADYLLGDSQVFKTRVDSLCFGGEAFG